MNPSPKVNVTVTRAEQLRGTLKAAHDDLEAHDELIATRHTEQEQALETLRARWRGLMSELEQKMGTVDRR